MKNYVEVSFLGRFTFREYDDKHTWFSILDNTGETVKQPYGKMSIEDMKALRKLLDREINHLEKFGKQTDFKELIAEIREYEPEMTEEEAYEMFDNLHQEAVQSYKKELKETGIEYPPKYCFKCKQLMRAGSLAYAEGFHFDTCI